MTATKQRDSSFAYRITLTEGYTIPIIPMTADESDRYRRLAPDNQPDFMRNIAIHHLTNDTAQNLVKRIKATTQSKLHNNTFPLRRQDYTPEIITAISSNLALVIARFNVNIAHGQNREWEVGKQSRYDDLDTQQSG